MTRPSDTKAVTLTDDEVELVNAACWQGVALPRQIAVVEQILAARLAGAGAQVTEAAFDEGATAEANAWRPERDELAAELARLKREMLALADQWSASCGDMVCDYGRCGCQLRTLALSAALPHMGTGQSEADLRARISALADKLDKWAEWNELTPKQRRERWPDDHAHNTSRPLASLRARSMVRALLDRPAAAEGNET